MRMGVGRTVRLATRGSALALWQVKHVSALLERQSGDLSFDYVPLSTLGDGVQDRAIVEIGGEGVFTRDLEEALRSGRVDAAVHSLKDLPTDPTPAILTAAICAREDARDVLIAREGWTLDALPSGARVGTSSARRTAQLQSIRRDLDIVPIRGNVDTRIRKVLDGEFDATVLAAAGIIRLEMQRCVTEYLSCEVMMPAPGQGALAVQCREDDLEMVHLLSRIDDPVSRSTTTAERAFLRTAGGGCSAPVAARAVVAKDGQTLELRGVVLAPDGSSRIDVTMNGAVTDAAVIGNTCARRALERGAGKWLR
jgi:hydroxymethylbilane synthase